MKQTKPIAVPNGASTTLTKSQPDIQEQIRLRAFALYEQRGREGFELEDWLQAESEVTQRKTKAAAR
jgi:Protein of unknown function (DUF2934)